MGERLHKVLVKIGSDLWCPWQQIAPIGLKWEHLVSTLASPILIGPSLFLQVTNTTIKSRTGLKFSKIQPEGVELAVLERLKKSP